MFAEKVTASDHGLLTNLLVGNRGAFVGGKLAEVLDVPVFSFFRTLVAAAVGAILLLWIWRVPRGPAVGAIGLAAHMRGVAGLTTTILVAEPAMFAFQGVSIAQTASAARHRATGVPHRQATHAGGIGTQTDMQTISAVVPFRSAAPPKSHASRSRRGFSLVLSGGRLLGRRPW